MSSAEPMIKLEPGGTAPILSYNVPEPTSYSGRNFIELIYDSGYFQSSLHNKSRISILSSPTSTMSDASRDEIINAMKNGFSDIKFFINSGSNNGSIRLVEKSNSDFEIISTEPISPKLAKLHPDEVTAAIHGGRKLIFYRSMFGTLTYDYARFMDNEMSTKESARIPAFMRMMRDGSPTEPMDDDEGGDPREVMWDMYITSPSYGAKISGPSNGVQVTVRGKTTIDPILVNKVEVQIGENNPFVLAIPHAPGDWEYWTKTLIVTTEGQQSITAKATSVDGKVKKDMRGITTSFVTTTDTTPPDVTITYPINNDTISAPSNGGVQVSVKGTAADNIGGSGMQHVEVKIGENPFKLAIPKATGDWSEWSSSFNVITGGQQTIVAKATDKAGNFRESTVNTNVQFSPITDTITGRRRLLLIESYRLSSYLGSYGAGRTIKTFSLLPGEKTKISVKSYMKKETDYKSASSILDSVTDESSQEFANSLEKEQSDKKSYQDSFAYEVNAKAQGSWGCGSAEISGGVKGGTNSSREEFGKNMSNCTQKHVSKASAKRDININTSFEIKEQTGEETSIEREIENINVSRTLNFVFRQMNQEFLTFLHLVDIRIAFFFDVKPSDPTTWIQREVSLSELDSLLKEFIVVGKRQVVKEDIINQLTYILDYNDQPKTDFIEKVSLTNNDANIVKEYWRVKKDYKSTYTDPVTQTTRDIPGVILNVDKYVLRTDGVIVEALLGQGDALDKYSHELQDESIRAKQLSNKLTETEIEKNNLGRKIIRDKDADAAKIFEQVYPCCPPKIRKEDDGPA